MDLSQCCHSLTWLNQKRDSNFRPKYTSKNWLPCLKKLNVINLKRSFRLVNCELNLSQCLYSFESFQCKHSVDGQSALFCPHQRPLIKRRAFVFGNCHILFSQTTSPEQFLSKIKKKYIYCSREESASHFSRRTLYKLKKFNRFLFLGAWSIKLS